MSKIINTAGILVSTSKKNIRILFVIERNGFVGTPGGGLNKGESPWVALKREFKEEVGLFPEKNNLDENKFYDFGNTRIFYGEIDSDIKYKPKAKVIETTGIIFPKLQSIVDEFITNPNDNKIKVSSGSNKFTMRKCVAQSFRSMIKKGIFDKYVIRSDVSSSCIIL